MRTASGIDNLRSLTQCTDALKGAFRRIARVRHDPVYLTRRGQRIAAVIDADDLDRLIAAAEDLADIEAARAARAVIADQGAIPWEQVKADVGLA